MLQIFFKDLDPDPEIVSKEETTDNIIITVAIVLELPLEIHCGRLGHKNRFWASAFCDAIFVRTGSGKAFSLSVEENDTIAHVQQLIDRKVGIPADQQVLSFAGRVLCHGSLKENRISRESTLLLLLKMRGGMYHFTRLGPFFC